MQRWWRLVLKYEGLPDIVDAEWMEEWDLDRSPEDYINQRNMVDTATQSIEPIAAIPITGPTT